MAKALQPSFDVCVRGAGVVGRVLALLLARASLRVALVVPSQGEAADTGHGDVRAYALNRASRAMLESFRCWPTSPACSPVRSMRIWGDDGGELEFQAAQAGAEALAWIMDVPALEALLAQAVQFQGHIDVVAEPVDAPLTVVCEGRASATRAGLAAEWDLMPYRHTAIAARLEGAQAHESVARQWFQAPRAPDAGDAGADVVALLPMQGNSVALVWSVHHDRAAQLMAATDLDFCNELAVACHQPADSFRLSSLRQAWPLQLAQARAWVGTLRDNASQSWALAGDAAHTVHPLSGQGLNLGLADAAELARVISTREAWRSVADLKPLRAYERARKLDAALLAGATDGLQRLFGHTDSRLSVLRNQGMRWFDASPLLKHWVAGRAMGSPKPF
ncbi:MAG: hypothetical protein RLZZ126_1472 [Pseudomonadota bacterium]|jgi:2-polyprenyl-6-methoxyphenol hydroxylase-like FAD-dependent oxidoreductase